MRLLANWPTEIKFDLAQLGGTSRITRLLTLAAAEALSSGTSKQNIKIFVSRKDSLKRDFKRVIERMSAENLMKSAPPLRLSDHIFSQNENVERKQLLNTKSHEEFSEKDENGFHLFLRHKQKTLKIELQTQKQFPHLYLTRAFKIKYSVLCSSSKSSTSLKAVASEHKPVSKLC